MFLKRTREGYLLPFGYRIAYWDALRNQSVSAPIGVHWIVRVVYLVWAWSFRFKPSKLEKLLDEAYVHGFEDGFEDGGMSVRTALGLKGQRVIDEMHARQEREKGGAA